MHDVSGVSARPGGRGRRLLAGRRSAFTLIELLSAMTIVALLAGLLVPRFGDSITKARVTRAISDLRAISVDLAALDSLPNSLAGIGRAGMRDPWGRPYVYLKFPPSRGNAPPRGARKDRFLVPINSRFDLYSSGPDGRTQAPLTAQASRDDIVVANDGGFIGPASKY